MADEFEPVEPTRFPSHCFTMAMLGLALLTILASTLYRWLSH